VVQCYFLRLETKVFFCFSKKNSFCLLMVGQFFLLRLYQHEYRIVLHPKSLGTHPATRPRDETFLLFPNNYASVSSSRRGTGPFLAKTMHCIMDHSALRRHRPVETPSPPYLGSPGTALADQTPR
jgi:hypothetical protein